MTCKEDGNGKDHVSQEQRLEPCSHQPQTIKSTSRGRGKEGILAKLLQECSTSTLISDFQGQGLEQVLLLCERGNFCCSKTPSLYGFVIAAIGN